MPITNNRTDQVKQQVKGKAKAALMAAGLEAVGMINKQMRDGYHDTHPVNPDMWDKIPPHTDIRITGDLMRDVHMGQVSDTQVRVGNSLEYGLFVHEGTQKLRGRPYIKDAIEDGKDRLKQLITDYLSD